MLTSLSVITFVPLIGAIVLLAIPGRMEETIRRIALVFSVIPFLLALNLAGHFDPALATYQFEESAAWIPTMNVTYHLGVDGLSMALTLLTTLLSLLCVLGSWGVAKRVKEYFIFFLVLECGMNGVFFALDLFLFYFFWEVMLVPMYFLIGIWGGPRREYAAIKFFLYTLTGSVLMLLAIIALYFHATPHTLDIPKLVELASAGAFTGLLGKLAFLGFFVGFAIKVPSFPFHTWLPDAHVEAPTAVSVILAGVLLKMGAYGFLRISFPILPLATKFFAPAIAALAIISIIYGAFVALAQTDLKKMVAYSSVSHMGFVMLGLAAMNEKGFSGSALQMITHGLITGALFFLVGVIYDRAHTRDIDAFGGLMTKVPVYTAMLSMTAFASLGLPGLAGFVAEFLCFMGGFEAYPVHTALATIGVVITAAFFLNMMQKMLLGTFNPKWDALTDMSTREIVTLAPLLVAMLYFGINPMPLIHLMNASLVNVLNVLKTVN